ncbi:MAG: NAD(P)H-hydrate dehydratase [Gemmatimonadota bacterium]|nr:MAG: NAD(P)H-hydrate dehydratase [Gemmatimonadota bacterium]
MRVSTVEEMRALDRRAMTEHAVPDHILMENAGEAVFFVILNEVGVRGRRFVVLSGAGNNGGDGFVVARKLHSTGGHVQVFVLGDPGGYRDAALLNYEMVTKCGTAVFVQPKTEKIRQAIAECDAVVDGLFGTGITRDVGGQFGEVIAEVNRSGKPVFSIDIPSGVDGNTGAIRGAAVQATATVTFGLPKRGNLLYPGAELGGQLYVTHISFPPQLQDSDEIGVYVNQPSPLPPRRVDGHKGSFGDVLFIAGARNYFGAPAFSALSLLKAGGGYSRLAAPCSVTPHVASLASEIVFAPQQETEFGSLALSAESELLDLAEMVDFAVLGPGVSVVAETQELVRRLAAGIAKPILIDGDGLTAVAEDLEVVRRRAETTVLTPHPGEMSRIAGVPIAEVQSDPIGVVQRVARDLGAIVVLKGAHSLIGFPDERVYINLSGNSGMASAGSGDVLTGTIAAMYGLGLPIDEAVRTGVFLHGFAGDLAAHEKGEDGITARDILEHLPAATKVYREDYAGVTANFYGAIEEI